MDEKLYFKIRLAEPTERGRLYYYRDPEIEKELLFFRSNIRRRMVYKLVINSVVLGIDVERVLYYVEVMKARVGWKIIDNVHLPHISTPADIIFPHLEEVANFVNHPIVVFSDPKFQVVHVKFGVETQTTNFIALSEQCYAQLNGDILIGFYIKLVDAPLKEYPS